MSVPDELRRYVPRTDLYDSLELVHYHMPVEQPPATASYIIFKKGNKTYAKNGTYGHIEFEDTDATNVIQYAANELTNGGIIHICPGLYLITKKITITKPYIWIRGSGRYATKLKLDDNVNDIMIEITLTEPSTHYLEDANSIIISDMTLDGNKASNTTASTCIYITDSYFPLFKNLAIYNAKDDGIEIWDADDPKFINLWVGNCSYGIEFRGGTHDAAVIGCTFQRNNPYGLAITSENAVIGCIFWANATGLYITGTENIINGSFEEDTVDGIAILNNDNVVSGAVIKNEGRDGIRIIDATDNVITGCRITGCVGYGVNETGTSDYTLICGCNLRGNTTGSYTFVGTNSSIYGSIT